MKSELKAEIVAACIRGSGGALSPFESREIVRVIAGDAARRERFMQKARALACKWQRSALRR
ncbi:MAG: hypothetical protein LBU96_13130 [Yokenella regensburgei]|nr:hypothetical protein [Yokenella regensburgei]